MHKIIKSYLEETREVSESLYDVATKYYPQGKESDLILEWMSLQETVLFFFIYEQIWNQDGFESGKINTVFYEWLKNKSYFTPGILMSMGGCGLAISSGQKTLGSKVVALHFRIFLTTRFLQANSQDVRDVLLVGFCKTHILKANMEDLKKYVGGCLAQQDLSMESRKEQYMMELQRICDDEQSREQNIIKDVLRFLQ